MGLSVRLREKDKSMNTSLVILAYTAGLIAVISAMQLALLAFRNPLRSEWLKKAGADTVTCVAMTAGLSFATAYEIAGLIAAGANVFVAIGVTIALIFGVALFNWRVFRFGERLRRADAGHSPFEHLHATQEPQRTPAAFG
jgi:hypothetical protein